MSDLTFHVIIDQCGSGPNRPEEEVARVLSVLIVVVLVSLILAPICWALGLQGPFHDGEVSLDKRAFKRKAKL